MELSKKEQIAKVLGYSLILVGVVTLLTLRTSQYTLMILALVLWCLLTGSWAVYSGVLFYAGSHKAPRAFVYDKTARFLGVILLIIPAYFLFLLLTEGSTL